MSDNLYLNWATLALSMFNTILLFWLGLTVLLNSDRRRPGIWIASVGLFVGSAFFVSHTALLGGNLLQFVWLGVIFWWGLGMGSAILLPYAWYLSMLWYAGYWDFPDSDLRNRHAPWFRITGLILVGGLAALLLTIILLITPRDWLRPARDFIRWSIAGIPLLAFAYSGYVILCIGLSLDALRRPGPTGRTMGMLARQRAKPWLVATTVAMLIVSLLVAGVLAWLAQIVREQTVFTAFSMVVSRLATLDLIIAGIIALAILSLGQAVVSYEVFTGRALPRRGLARHWLRAIIMAAGFSMLLAGTVAFQLRSIYAQLLAILALTLFFGLFSWRAYAERERFMENLRPFMVSHHLYDNLLRSTAPPDIDINAPFYALCHDVLGAQVAYLAPVGALAPLFDQPLAYPENNRREIAGISPLSTQFAAPDTKLLPLNPDEFGGAIWGIPLWSERGLIGLFLLGEKRDNGLYSQEEIDLARVSGERLIDTQASAEMGRRLIALQRERLTQSQMTDQRSRRVLHDDILPTIHSAMITLSENKSDPSVVSALTDAHRQISDLLRDMPQAVHPDIAKVGALRALQRVVEAEYKHAFDEVEWDFSPDAMEKAAALPPLSAEALFYAAREAIRNAAQHGRPPGSAARFCLRGSAKGKDGFQLQIEDNGIGLNEWSPNKGAGQGMALHSAMMAVVGGTLGVESEPGEFTRVTLSV